MIGALTDAVVLDLTSNVAGPYATSILRDLGATVWKVERPGGGDVVRGWPPFATGVSTTFAALNRGKRSVAVDLKTGEGRSVLAELVKRADVVVDSMRPGALARLGFDWPAIQALNPRAISSSITAYGPTGPDAGEPGFDAIIQARSGLLELTGHPDGPPARVGTGIVDFGTGLWSVIGVLGALLERERTGRGVEVGATLLGTAVAFQPHHLASILLAGVVPRRLGTAQHNAAPYEAIQAKDGLVMIGVANDGLWRRFLAAVDDGRLADDPRFATNADRVAHRSELNAMIGELVADRTGGELVTALGAAGIPASLIRDIADLPADPQVRAMDLLPRWASGHTLPVVPVTVGDDPVDTADGPPALGRDTRAVLRRAGYEEADIDRLAAAGTIGLDPEGTEA